MHDRGDRDRPDDFAVAPLAHERRKTRALRGDTGVPRERVSVKPFTKNSVPSVVTKEGMRRYTVTAPLITPTTPAASTPASRASHTGAPASLAKCMMNGANAKTMPAERSISPPIMSMISPQAMIATGAMNCERFSRLALVSRKSWLAVSK